MEKGTKLRILYLYQHLVKHTDAEYTLSTAELIRILKEQYKLSVSRNTISDDLIILHDCGLHIEHYESTQNKYYFDGQIYDLAELKVLVDAISSSKFITQRKSEELIAKLLTLTNDHHAAKLRRHIYALDRVKSDNENGYYIVDALNEAIDKKRKVKFYYTDFDVNKKRYITNEGNPYTLSPYALIWDGDYYYVRGFCDDRNALRTFRVDRILRQPHILEEVAVIAPDGYTPSQFNKSVFRMLENENAKEIRLRCHVSTMKYLIDKFGKDVKTIPTDENTFEATVFVSPSPTFYRWIFGFMGKIQLLGPAEIVDQYREMAQCAISSCNVEKWAFDT